MIRVHLFGAGDLRSEDGSVVRSVLAQPKRLALLAFLAGGPRSGRRRDQLLATFWPEATEERARNALNQSLHFLRRSLGDDVLVSRGGETLALSEEGIWCDVAAFERALDAGRFEEALSLYRGDLLEGFHLPDAPGFEDWVEEERARLRSRAAAAAWRCASSAASGGEDLSAREYAARAVALAPVDESGVQRFMTLADRLGDPAAALRAFEEFRERLRREYEAVPADSTAQLADAIRTRSGSPRPAPAAQPAPLPELRGPRAATAERPDLPGRVGAKARIAAVGVAVALIGFLGYRLAVQPQRPDPSADTAVVVLPFVDFDESGSNDYFGSGMAEALTTQLAQASGFRVAARSSAEAAQRMRLAPHEIGERLRVTHIIQGSFRLEEDRAHLAVHLVDASTGYHVWSKTYERDTDELSSVQREIVTRVVATLRPEARGERWPPSSSHVPGGDAYTLYLKGRHALNQRSLQGVRTAASYFQQAIALEPGFAAAHVGLADAYQISPDYGGGSPHQMVPLARAAAMRALELDPMLPDAYASLGNIKDDYDWDWAGSRQMFERALSLDPNHAAARAWYADHLLHTGHTRRGIEEYRRAQQLDPLSPAIGANLGKALFQARRYKEVLETEREVLRLHPDYGVARFWMSQALIGLRRYSEAEEQLLLAAPTPDRRSILAYLYAITGRSAEAREILAELEDPRTFASPYRIAVVYAALGETDRAFAWLDRAYETRDSWLTAAINDPFMDGLRDDPRFESLLARIGIAS